ncbi:hypothetical protein HQN64_19500 [Enterobacteriaceae bacterium BIT-l23]|uniref:hypothetical protein n=1 Tax=Jejubacter sp. L23 TaxID=3092086 RepID=UPI001584E825|nr:hypothetical protein [Enterobacteriaceae bacterium BIT-l23]
MIRTHLVKPALFLLLVLGFICLLINEVHAWHCWHDRFYTRHDVQQPQIFDIASDAPLSVQARTQHLTSAMPMSTYRMVQ